jgi:regulator of RNase E activity RraA
MLLDDDLVARFKEVPTSLVTDAFLRLGISGWMDEVLPLSMGMRVFGRARTLDYGPIGQVPKLAASTYKVISWIDLGEVLVVGAGGTHDNLFGDNGISFALRSGLAGLVTDSKTRDRAGMQELGFPVFSRGAAARPPMEVEPHTFDQEIACGGVTVRPGDLIVGDDDGVVVIPAERAAEVLYQIEDIAGLEEAIGEVIAKGGSVAEIEAAVARKKVVRA